MRNLPSSGRTCLLWAGPRHARHLRLVGAPRLRLSARLRRAARAGWPRDSSRSSLPSPPSVLLFPAPPTPPPTPPRQLLLFLLFASSLSTVPTLSRGGRAARCRRRRAILGRRAAPVSFSISCVASIHTSSAFTPHLHSHPPLRRRRLVVPAKGGPARRRGRDRTVRPGAPARHLARRAAVRRARGGQPRDAARRQPRAAGVRPRVPLRRGGGGGASYVDAARLRCAAPVGDPPRWPSPASHAFTLAPAATRAEAEALLLLGEAVVTTVASFVDSGSLRCAPRCSQMRKVAISGR